MGVFHGKDTRMAGSSGCVALREFQKHQGGKNERDEPVYGDLRHYEVWIVQSPPDLLPINCANEECVHVSFVPDSAPNDRYEVGVRGQLRHLKTYVEDCQNQLCQMKRHLTIR